MASAFMETLRRDIRLRGYSMRTEKPTYIGFAVLSILLISATHQKLVPLKLKRFLPTLP